MSTAGTSPVSALAFCVVVRHSSLLSVNDIVRVFTDCYLALGDFLVVSTILKKGQTTAVHRFLDADGVYGVATISLFYSVFLPGG